MTKPISAIVVLLLLISYNSLYAQHEFGLKLTGGFGGIYDGNPDKTTNTYIGSDGTSYNDNATEKIVLKLSYQAGLFYTVKINKSSYIGSELLFSNVGGRSDFNGIYTNSSNGLFASNYHYELDNRIKSISIPIYYGFEFNRVFSINLGLQYQNIFSYKENTTGVIENPVGNILTFGTSSSSQNNIKIYGLGIRGGLFVRLSNRITLEANTYREFRSNLKNFQHTQWKLFQTTAGIRYAVFKRKSRDTK